MRIPFPPPEPGLRRHAAPGRSRHRRILLLSAIASLLVSPVRAQVVDELGPATGWAVSLSANGRAVTDLGGPIVWTEADGRQTVGTGLAAALSADGSTVAGWTLQECGGATSSGWTWSQQAGITPLGEEGTQQAASPCIEVHDMSDDGTVVVGSFWAAAYGEPCTTGTRAVRWVNGVPTNLGLLHTLAHPDFPELCWNGFMSSATGVSGDGTVVVGYSNALREDGQWTRGFAAFRWKDGSMAELGKGFACGVSSDGRVAVGSTDPFNEAGPPQAVRWVNGVREVLGPGRALASNRDGTVIVGDAFSLSSVPMCKARADQGAFIWTEEDGYRLLEDVLREDFDYSNSALSFSMATAVSDDGLTLAGFDVPAGTAWRLQFCGGTAEWNNPAGGSFDDDENWLDLAAPTTVQTARFDYGQSYSVSFSRDVEHDKLEVRSGVKPRFSLGSTTWTLSGACADVSSSVVGASPQFTGGTVHSKHHSLVDGLAGTPAEVTLEGQDMEYREDSTMTVGFEAKGSLRSRDGAAVETLDLVLGERSGGDGLLELRGGATLMVRRDLVMSSESGAQSTLDASGANTRIDLTGLADVGVSDIATLRVGDKAFIRFGDMALGLESEGTGVLDLADGTAEGEQLSVGAAGTGQVQVSNRGLLGVQTLSVGEEAGSEGSMDVIGEELALVTVAGAAEVGISGEGTLRVSGMGAILSLDNGMTLGSDSGGSGTVEVVDGGFVGAEPGLVRVAGGGDGLIDIAGGGRLTGASIQVGTQSGFGTIEIRGSGSRLDATEMELGPRGVLMVRDAGLASLENLFIAGGPGAIALGGTIDATIVTVGPAPGPGKRAAVASEGVRVDTLHVQGDAARIITDSLAVLPGGVIGGSGLFPVPLTSAGTISPSDTSGVIGAFRLASDLTLGAESLTEIDLAGPDAFDRIEAGGVVRLGGALSIRTVGGYVPGAGDSFEIVAGSALEGTFASIDAGPLAVSVVYTDRAVRVTVDGFVGTDGVELPERFFLGSNYPNPFNPQTVIPFELPASSPVLVEVLDVTGRRVDVVVDGTLPAGRHEAMWAAGDRPSGVYLVRLRAGGVVLTRAVTLVR